MCVCVCVAMPYVHLCASIHMYVCHSVGVGGEEGGGGQRMGCSGKEMRRETGKQRGADKDGEWGRGRGVEKEWAGERDRWGRKREMGEKEREAEERSSAIFQSPRPGIR